MNAIYCICFLLAVSANTNSHSQLQFILSIDKFRPKCSYVYPKGIRFNALRSACYTVFIVPQRISYYNQGEQWSFPSERIVSNVARNNLPFDLWYSVACTYMQIRLNISKLCVFNWMKWNESTPDHTSSARNHNIDFCCMCTESDDCGCHVDDATFRVR